MASFSLQINRGQLIHKMCASWIKIGNLISKHVLANLIWRNWLLYTVLLQLHDFKPQDEMSLPHSTKRKWVNWVSFVLQNTQNNRGWFFAWYKDWLEISNGEPKSRRSAIVLPLSSLCLMQIYIWCTGARFCFSLFCHLIIRSRWQECLIRLEEPLPPPTFSWPYVTRMNSSKTQQSG